MIVSQACCEQPSIRTHWSAHQAPSLVFVARHGISGALPWGGGLLGRRGRESRAPWALRTRVGVHDRVCLQAGILDAGVVLQQESPLRLKEVIHLLREQDKTHLHHVTKSMAATDNRVAQSPCRPVASLP